MGADLVVMQGPCRGHAGAMHVLNPRNFMEVASNLFKFAECWLWMTEKSEKHLAIVSGGLKLVENLLKSSSLPRHCCPTGILVTPCDTLKVLPCHQQLLGNWR